MQIITRGAWLWVVGFVVGCIVGALLIAPRISHAQTTAWDFGESSSGSWDEYDLNTQLGTGDVVIGNRWHATSTDALSICGFRSWWKKNSDIAMRSPILNFGYLPLGHTTGTIDDVTVISTSTVVSTGIGTSETQIDTYLPACMTVNSGITWAIYYEVRTASSSYVTWTNDLGGDNHVQLSSESASGVEYYASGDLKMGMAQLITSEAPAVTIPDRCVWGLFCPLYDLLTNASRYLFVPSEQSIATLTIKTDTLKTKVPYGWIAQVSSTWSGLYNENATTSDADFNFIIPATGDSETTTTVKIFNPQEVRDAIPTEPLEALKSVMRVVIWFFFFWFIYHLAFGHEDDDGI